MRPGFALRFLLSLEDAATLAFGATFRGMAITARWRGVMLGYLYVTRGNVVWDSRQHGRVFNSVEEGLSEVTTLLGDSPAYA
jgi:hypothetical protein